MIRSMNDLMPSIGQVKSSVAQALRGSDSQASDKLPASVRSSSSVVHLSQEAQNRLNAENAQDGKAASLANVTQENAEKVMNATDKAGQSAAGAVKNKEDDDDLPEHIKMIKQRLKQIREQLERAKEAVQEVLLDSELSDEERSERLNQTQAQVKILQIQELSMMKKLADAIKSAGLKPQQMAKAWS